MLLNSFLKGIYFRKTLIFLVDVKNMNFKLEGFVSKLKSPVIVVADVTMEEYEPDVLAQKEFSKRNEIKSISAKSDKFIMELAEIVLTVPINYIGEETQL